jgi:hypothetical protein
MKLFKHPEEGTTLYQVHELTEEQLIGIFGMCVNYKPYVAQLLKLPNSSLKKIVPGGDVQAFKESVAIQIKAADDYMVFWKEVCKNAPDKSQN